MYRGDGGAMATSKHMKDYLEVRFCIFDYPSCDRSLWNSSLEIAERPYSQASAAAGYADDINQQPFLLYHDSLKENFRQIFHEANGIDGEEDDYSSLETAASEVDDL